MGIPGLWDFISDCKEIVKLAEYATQHFEQYKRPLRIAVDEATWRHKLYISNKAKLCKEYSNLHLNERNLVSVVLRLLKLNIQLVFVADGPDKPGEKYGAKGGGVWKYKSEVLQDCLRLLGVKWHEAPGEAEAECAVLQRRGVVDCVWTEDGDALMFGCGFLMRFCYSDEEEGNWEKKERGKGGGGWTAKRSGMKDLDKIVLYKASVVESKHPGFDREGWLLFVLLRGGDYGKGLHGCGVWKASKVVELGFAKELFEVMKTSEDLDTWRTKLRKHFVDSNTGVSVPWNFPDERILGLYKSPTVSSVERLRKLENVWSGRIDERKLQPFLLEKFDWGINKYLDYIVPIILTQSLASFDRNGESNIDEYNLIYMESGLTCNVWFSLFAVTSLGKEWVDRCVEDLNKKRPKRWKRYEIPWGNGPMGEGKGLLTCVVKHAMEPEISLVPDAEPELEHSVSKNRRRSFSPHRMVLEDRTRMKKPRVSISPPLTPTPQDRFTVTKEEISIDISLYEDSDDDLFGSTEEISKPPRQSTVFDGQERQRGYYTSTEMKLDSSKSLKSTGSHAYRVISPSPTNHKPQSTQDSQMNLLSNFKHSAIPLPLSTQSTPINEEYTNTFHIAMDEPLDSDSEFEFEFPNPLPFNCQPTNLENDSTTDFTNDTFTIAMDEPLDLDLDLESEPESLHITSHIPSNPASQLNNTSSSSNLLGTNTDLNTNTNNWISPPNPNILLYPAHPTGPYQELDISSFFSSGLSQSQSQSQS
ncbi:uncharacterized protein EAF01_006390 [Botrytis porri]|uniref:XPG-I domain-containing protein n=1 Tax=Botrytis porri TaxID=87229 RepID=A0A4Z1KVW6_9HELO|nr:uncharacterized protein EAF01_006390 [Botrytis porri]KAF7903341.1 hypothetical protein EAF01_006390 [Botrytis porri]TGO88682.1 hypothetical protein BPOR_0148g00150 [Botrytis porri]